MTITQASSPMINPLKEYYRFSSENDQLLGTLDISQLPDHRQLPCEDGTFVKNFQEPLQGYLLTDTSRRHLQNLHPDGQYVVGQDNGIYWRFTDPPLRGVKSPDWFYVPNVPPLIEGEMRRSYVLWKERRIPLLVIEFVSDEGEGERDRTPPNQLDEKGEELPIGKLWVYEQAIGIPYYAIYEVESGTVEVYQLIDGRYQLMTANQRGHYLIPPMRLELGIWLGTYCQYHLPWLRWWDENGNLLLTGAEESGLLRLDLDIERDRAETQHQRAETEQQRAEAERQRAETERQRAETERQRAEVASQQLEAERHRAEVASQQLEAERHRAEKLAQMLREMNIDPDTL